MQQIGPPQDWQAVIARRTDKVEAPLVGVNRCRERTADHRKRDLRTLYAPDSNSNRYPKRRERTKDSDWVTPYAIRARHDVHVGREIPDEVILQQKHSDKTCDDHPGRRQQTWGKHLHATCYTAPHALPSRIG